MHSSSLIEEIARLRDACRQIHQASRLAFTEPLTQQDPVYELFAGGTLAPGSRAFSFQSALRAEAEELREVLRSIECLAAEALF